MGVHEMIHKNILHYVLQHLDLLMSKSTILQVPRDAGPELPYNHDDMVRKCGA